MIGYYVHHHGVGHLHRALTVARACEVPVTGLSSLPRPADWEGEWVTLPRDDMGEAATDASARGRLHWVPERDDGLRSRGAAISAWIERFAPTLVVVDVSVEVALLARLHGVPVVTSVLPGDRGDAPHRLVHDVARRVVAAWPSSIPSLASGVDRTIDAVGAFSRFDGRPRAAPRAATPRVVLLSGRGGRGMSAADLARAQDETLGWEWVVLDPHLGGWCDDPWDLLCSADVVVTHAGQNSLAEVAAAQVPAVVVPQQRPHDEQLATARALSDGWPAVVLERTSQQGWAGHLERAALLDGSRWDRWNDGLGARRVAAILAQEAGR